MRLADIDFHLMDDRKNAMIFFLHSFIIKAHLFHYSALTALITPTPLQNHVFVLLDPLDLQE